MEVGDLSDDPLVQLATWQEEARGAGEPMPESMCVATADADATPSARMVLLRGLDHGLVFYTDYASTKGVDLAANPRAAALLHWYRPVHRQVRVAGVVTKTSPEESDRYWESRPPASRRSAVASRQSSVLHSREELERAVEELGSGPPPARPERWGGFRLSPRSVEFWQEGKDRLHDRILYTRTREGWRTERLSP